MILLLAVYILFAAGVTKLIQSGPAWMDGVSLYFYLEHHNHPSTPIGKWLLGVLLQHPSYVTCLAVATVCFELAILAALFFPRTRWLLFLAACGFHIGIYLLMYPRYFEQMVVYLLVVPWEIFRVKPWRERCVMLLGFRSPPAPSSLSKLPRPLVRFGLVSFAGVTVLVLTGTIALQREWFPLTHVPMYSSYVSNERIGAIAREEFGSLAGLARVAARIQNEDLPWWSKYEIGNRIVVYGYEGDKKIRVPLTPEFPRVVLNQFLWFQRASSSLLDDLRGKKLSQSTRSSSFEKMERLALGIQEPLLSVLNWECFERFDICFNDEDVGPVPLVTFHR
jgi:hypothetical protein